MLLVDGLYDSTGGFAMFRMLRKGFTISTGSSIGIAAYLTAALLLVAPATADDVGSIADSGDENARASFGVFAKSWMAKMQRVEEDNKNSPTIRRGASANFVGYRGFGDDYSVEMRPTGHPSAPFIGILRYTERMYSCRESASSRCSIASSSPVTEIFRYSSGSWRY
jgi:hypothetical protein